MEQAQKLTTFAQLLPRSDLASSIPLAYWNRLSRTPALHSHSVKGFNRLQSLIFDATRNRGLL